MPVAYVTPVLEKLQAELPTYIHEARVRTHEESKKILFAGFLQDVFGVAIQDFSRLMERFVESKALVVKGHVDAVFGNLVIEFKRNLQSGLEDAKRELVKYLQSLREEFPTQPYVGLATDGLAFLVFKPTVNDVGTVSGLKQIDSLNLESQEDPKTIYLWFDAYLFSSKQIAPSTEDLKRRFGVESPTFYFIQEELLQLLTYLKEEPSVKLKLSSWSRYLELPTEQASGQPNFLPSIRTWQLSRNWSFSNALNRAGFRLGRSYLTFSTGRLLGTLASLTSLTRTFSPGFFTQG